MKKDFYEWYNEEIRPQLMLITAKLKERNAGMEYAFIVGEPNYEEQTFNCVSDYEANRSNLLNAVTDDIENYLMDVTRKVN